MSGDAFRKRLDYDPQSGRITWKDGARAGEEAGWIGTHGYLVIQIFRKQYRAHRLAWLLQTGEWPAMDVDHKNGRRTDNRWRNLRLATKSQNQMNKPKSGVSRLPDRRKWRADLPRERWVARIQSHGRDQYLGTFSSQLEAETAYREASHALHGDFSAFGRGK